jgi:hypothetical protein
MNRIRRLALAPVAASVVMLAGTTPVLAADTVTDAFREGEWKLNFRQRIEVVDQENFSKNAKGSTLRTRLNWGSGEVNGFSVFAEADYVLNVFLDDYNAGGGNTPGRSDYPVIADPDGEDLNQAFLQYKRGKSQFRVGRQRIILDNARFVGNVGWRQNEQTYDAVSWKRKGEFVDFDYAWVKNVNRIFGEDVAAGNHRGSTHLFNISHQFEGVGKLTGYLYDIDNDEAAAFSTSTYGLRFNGKHEELSYTLEYARQSDNANNPVDYDADYLRLDLGLKLGPVTPYFGYELLEGDTTPGKAFRTPLATLHAFNGWADKFLTTPDQGLEDMFVGFKGKSGSWTWNVAYHVFSGDAESGDLGSEIDSSFATKFGKRYGLLFKFANFNTDTPAYDDTNKYWMMLTADF